MRDIEGRALEIIERLNSALAMFSALYHHAEEFQLPLVADALKRASETMSNNQETLMDDIEKRSPLDESDVNKLSDTIHNVRAINRVMIYRCIAATHGIEQKTLKTMKRQPRSL